MQEERESVVLKNQGQRIFGTLHLPNKQIAPAVLMCHGFAGNRIGKYRIYVSIAKRLAELGVASLRIDYRGSGESEGDFAEMTPESSVEDVLLALTFLRNTARINPHQIGLLGNSFGAAIAVLAAQRDQHIQSIALLAALFNSQPWLGLWNRIGQKQDLETQIELNKILDGHVPGQAFFESFMKLDVGSALQSLHKIPLLHIHSDRDKRVGIDQAELYKKNRQKAEVESKWIRLNQCDHDFGHPEERATLIEEVAKWFVRTLT